MSDPKQPDTKPSAEPAAAGLEQTDQPQSGASAEAEAVGDSSLASPAADNASPVPTARLSTGLSLLAIALVLVLVLASGFAGYRVYPHWQLVSGKVAALQSEVNELRQQGEQSQQQLARAQKTLAAGLQQDQAAQSQLVEQLQAMNERLNAHNDRLLSLSNTSREDWLLAEAHYLLRLASQRLLVERQGSAALGLMEATDDILRQLSMPDLFPVRKALASDLAAVRLAADIDKEGIYLRLQGLADNIDALPLYEIPAITINNTQSEEAAADVTTDASDSGFWAWLDQLPGKVWRMISQVPGWVASRIDNYVRLQDHQQPITPLLPPAASEYLRQNVRLSLEQAQVAMLREQGEVYRASLTQASKLISTQFPASPAKAALLAELDALAVRRVTVTLPKISGSINQLQAYIERLHQLQGAPAEPEAP